MRGIREQQRWQYGDGSIGIMALALR